MAANYEIGEVAEPGAKQKYKTLIEKQMIDYDTEQQ